MLVVDRNNTTRVVADAKRIIETPEGIEIRFRRVLSG
jgi:hypothetical protein